ncbi:MAG: hypothetical protein JXA44_04055 [Methanospirillaceae archaeon]|nr:hypothetical protein [Methanospirillaceae archaeon]
MEQSIARLIFTETFCEIPVRFVQGDHGPMIPLIDIATGIDYSRQAMRQLYERNFDLLKDDAQDIVMLSWGQIAPIPHICLNRDGVIGILMKLDYQRIKDPERRERIISFQKWAKHTLGKALFSSSVKHSNPAIWKRERAEIKSTEKLCMEYVKRYEVPKQVWRNPRDPYQRENREVNVDTIGVHIRGLSDKLNEDGLQIKNEAYLIDMSLMEAGIDFDPRHQIIRNTLQLTHGIRCPETLLLTVTEQERLKKQLPASQTGIFDFVAVTA